jgi:dihydropteroate synthase
MGIVNVTPDSFSDGGDFAKSQTAIDHGVQLAVEGATILDVGGESTRPGASKPSIDEELTRVLPVIEQLAKLGHVVSVDTRRTKVMKAAVRAGAQIINDVSALRGDPESLGFVALSDLPVVLMHMQGTPETMQKAPTYGQVVLDVYDFLEQRMQACLDAGLQRKKIALDPGIGFGKTIDHNLSLINYLSVLKGLGCPILMGLSRKAFIGKLSGAGEAKDRMAGTVAANLESIRQGANLLRVHDVKENFQAVKIHKALESNSF